MLHELSIPDIDLEMSWFAKYMVKLSSRDSCNS